MKHTIVKRKIKVLKKEKEIEVELEKSSDRTFLRCRGEEGSMVVAIFDGNKLIVSPYYLELYGMELHVDDGFDVRTGTRKRSKR